MEKNLEMIFIGPPGINYNGRPLKIATPGHSQP
jgi:hypothetical protein